MPRNHTKTRCQIPNCRSWAMHGHTHCRAHRDAELGPRGAGAPLRNLNALKTGDYLQPLPLPELLDLAHQIVLQPDETPYLLGRAAQSYHQRTRNPVKTILTLRGLLAKLAPTVGEELFAVELETLLRQLAPSRRHRVQATLWKQTLHLGPVEKLVLIRTVSRKMEEKSIIGTTIDGTASPSPEPDPPESAPAALPASDSGD